MHLLPTTQIGMDEVDQAVDLALPPGDVVGLSFSDSDLAALAQAAEGLPFSVRLASLRRLRHPLSVDLFAEKTAAKARFILVRCLGGADYWRYGLERLATLARANGIALAVIQGCDRPDPRLAEFGTVDPAFADALLACFQAGGGVANMRLVLEAIGRHMRDGAAIVAPPLAMPPLFAVDAAGAPMPWPAALAATDPERPVVPVLVYRSSVSAGDVAPAMALREALAERGLAPLVLAGSSLKDAGLAAAMRDLIASRRPAAVVTTMAFSARDGADFVLDRAACPLFQAVPVGTSREAWAASPRGLSAVDLAMQVALPEFDGRLSGPPIAFKSERTIGETGLTIRHFEADGVGISQLADQVAGWVALGAKPRADRRLALVLSDYPAKGGRAGFAVGLDTPASAAAIQDLLREAGYALAAPLPGPALMAALTEGPPSFSLPLAAYRDWLAGLPAEAGAALLAAHGDPQDDPQVVDGAFRFPAVRNGRLVIALQPPRDHGADRKAAYHDPDRPPCHGYLAFYLALRRVEHIDALIHLGTHGNTEWLPGKAVALSSQCWPRLATGALPVIYPYIVDDPGEAAPAKRRLGAVMIGHLPPPLHVAGAAGDAALLRDLVEEYAAAQVMDPRRAALVAGDIRARAEASGLAAACGVTPDMPMDAALAALDAHLCDLAELPFRDGLHVFGASDADPASAAGERAGLLAALDGRFVVPGPAGSPHRGRADVLPTGRNLSTLDPRAIPTRAAAALGRKAAEAIITRHLQDEGDYPRAIVMDLWASPTLRSGGEDIAHALWLMGVEPVWDAASARVSGFAIVPLPKLDRPRLDVTVRISGAFRDTFPAQIALIDAAAKAIAALDEHDEWNALAAARRRGEAAARVFGAAPGRYGAATADLALGDAWQTREHLGAAYLAATSHAYGGAEGEAWADAGFAARIGAAQAFIHVSDTAGRDILEATSAADAIGGFAAAAQAAGARPALYSLDTTDPERPRARSVAEDLSRLVHGRLAHPRWIEGQMRHGWRGAAELAEGIDALFVFAATGAAPPAVLDGLFDTLFDAWIGDAAVSDALVHANPAAFAAIRARLDEARARGLWHSRRNSVAAALGARPLPEAAE